jgi:hypothetical protein
MSGIKCGKCKQHHETVEEVRNCYNTENSPQYGSFYHGTQEILPIEPQSQDMPAPVTEAGMYKLGDTIFKVQVAVHGSGHLYAKELERDLNGAWKFNYAPGAIRRLTTKDRLTLEQAKEFGALYGTCCVCGRTLTNEDSIKEGIGPICSGKMGW